MISYLLFTAQWSKPSLEVKDTLEKFFTEHQVLVCDGASTHREHERYAIRKLPTLVQLKDGVEVKRTNAVDIAELHKFFKE